MKKRMAVIVMLLSLAMCTLPVSAGEITEEEPSGNTEVTASVSNSGDVSYVISIPDKVDFGVLHQPKDSTSSNIVEKDYTVSTKKVVGLDSTKSRVVVLLKDADNKGFQLTGQSTANSGKKLDYSVRNEGGADIMTEQRFPNGYLLALFSDAEQTVHGRLQIDQNQLIGQDMDEWAGSYKGTINFYSAIKSVDDIN